TGIAAAAGSARLFIDGGIPGLDPTSGRVCPIRRMRRSTCCAPYTSIPCYRIPDSASAQNPFLPWVLGGTLGVAALAPLGVDIQALDFLVQRRKRDVKAFGGFGLAPVGALQH